jgi:hypothetical protein
MTQSIQPNEFEAAGFSADIADYSSAHIGVNRIWNSPNRRNERPACEYEFSSRFGIVRNTL